ncbi:Hypothetical protein MAGb_3180 [Mycoplasmopsis agalactiae 14628]|uniref:Uncharacterized protein n=1 Tax=Mycoplasmopsis agalactiae 14628 TaxID=1110504 RepID=I5D6A0_MYCAA|nr:hypothetical protein [Mycoplasmopsis agalactiae]EIN15209.1 Hypothetical protein MAGb_3180 [Mycoplasmopsis agalactiae 14628]
MNWEQQLANNLYNKLNNSINSLPPFSYQIIEHSNNNALLFRMQNTNAFPLYFNDDYLRVSYRVVLLDDKFNHSEQLNRLQKIIEQLASYWSDENFDIIKKQINNMNIAPNSKTNVLQVNNVNFALESQEYTFNIDLLVKKKGIYEK